MCRAAELETVLEATVLTIVLVMPHQPETRDRAASEAIPNGGVTFALKRRHASRSSRAALSRRAIELGNVGLCLASDASRRGERAEETKMDGLLR